MTKVYKIAKKDDIRVDENELYSAVYKKYKTLEKLGDKLGITKQAVSKKLKKPNIKFLTDLKDKAQVDISGIGFISNNKGIINTGNLSDRELKDKLLDALLRIEKINAENERLKKLVEELGGAR